MTVPKLPSLNNVRKNIDLVRAAIFDFVKEYRIHSIEEIHNDWSILSLNTLDELEYAFIINVGRKKKKFFHPKVVVMNQQELAEVPVLKTDFLIARNLLISFDKASIVKLLYKVHNASVKFIAFSYFLREDTYVDRRGFYPTNFTLPPFNFPAPIISLKDREPNEQDHYSDKRIGVWKVQDIISSMRSIENMSLVEDSDQRRTLLESKFQTFIRGSSIDFTLNIHSNQADSRCNQMLLSKDILSLSVKSAQDFSEKSDVFNYILKSQSATLKKCVLVRLEDGVFRLKAHLSFIKLCISNAVGYYGLTYKKEKNLELIEVNKSLVRFPAPLVEWVESERSSTYTGIWEIYTLREFLEKHYLLTLKERAYDSENSY
ncbi:MAG: hypothetical protein HC921_18930 [Synechococcaceae cyanobacterium SM2_3_1]|nr:hypothetical protein [Synechococcaceae cyanobacterium SM2_3_1]